jgi:hypothetical protein
MSLDSSNSDFVPPVKFKPRHRHVIDASLFDEDCAEKRDSDEDDLPEFLH